ncbi:hypothetical protein HN51_017911 [Arachis hypogaea]|nr:RW1-like protein [Arachis hypogaea]
MEFVSTCIEDDGGSKEKEGKKLREHVNVKDKCPKSKKFWSLPFRPYCFWTFERHNYSELRLGHQDQSSSTRMLKVMVVTIYMRRLIGIVEEVEGAGCNVE